MLRIDSRMTGIRLPLLLGVLLVYGAMGLGCVRNTGISGPRHRDVSPDRINQAIVLGTDYLVRMCGKDGRFVYQAHPASRAVDGQEYNILRHAGTIYALAQTFAWSPDAKIAAALRRSSQYLLERSAAPIRDSQSNREMLGIWSRQDIEGGNQTAQAKTGGTALGIIALISAEKIVPGVVSRAQLQQMGHFLLFLQNRNGSFYSRYIPDAGGRVDQPQSDYYPGQAALALLMLHEIDPGQKWLEGATLALAHIIQERPRIVIEQWTALACAKLLSTSWPERILSRETVRRYAEQLAKMIMEEHLLYADNPAHIGSLEPGGRTAATATRVEALLAIHEILDRTDTMLLRSIQACSSDAVGFLVDAQFTSGKCAGGIPRTAGIGGMGSRSRERMVRIDYVQHFLSALIGFARLEGS